MGEWLDQWLESRQGDVARKTREHDEPRVRNHLKPRIGSIRLEKLTAASVDKMLTEMRRDGKSPSERYKAHKVLREALN